MDTISHYLCKPDGTAIAEKVAKPEEPLKVGDWVEWSVAGGELDQFQKLVHFPAEIEYIDEEGHCFIHGTCFRPRRLRRVPAPSEHVEQADRTPGRDRIVALERERDGLRSQLAEVKRERDEYAEVINLVPPAHRVVCREGGAYEQKTATLCLSVGRLADFLKKSEAERDQLRDQLTTAQAEAAAWRECVMEPMRDWDSLFNQLEHVACERTDRLKGREWASDHLDRINRTKNVHPTNELLKELRRKDEEIKRLISERDELKRERATRLCDVDRIKEWWNSSPRKNSALAFTCGPDRSIAIGMELIAEERDQLREQLSTAQAEAAAMREQLAKQALLVAIAREIVDAIGDGGFLTGESNSPKLGYHQVVIKFRDIHKMQRLYSEIIALGIKLRNVGAA